MVRSLHGYDDRAAESHVLGMIDPNILGLC